MCYSKLPEFSNNQVHSIRIKISLKAVRFFCLFVIREGLVVKGRKKPKKLTAKTI